jgi:hypothetical protein
MGAGSRAEDQRDRNHCCAAATIEENPPVPITVIGLDHSREPGDLRVRHAHRQAEQVLSSRFGGPRWLGGVSADVFGRVCSKGDDGVCHVDGGR